jgi:hypothetical protein
MAELEVIGLRRRSVLVLMLSTFIVVAGCGGGGGGGGAGGGGDGATQHVERGVWYPITFDPPCSGADVPNVVFDGSRWTVSLVRDDAGHILTPADLAKDPTGQMRLVSDDLAEFEGQSGPALRASFQRQKGSPAPCP